MEKLQSSRPWRRPINGSSILAGSDYNDVFGMPPCHSASFSMQPDDYSEIFGAAASVSSIPVLDLSLTESGEVVGGCAGAGAGDYFDIFGSFGGGGFAVSYEELFAEPKSSGVSSSEDRARWDLLSKQQKKNASEQPLKVYTENNEPILEKSHNSSFPRQSDDNGSKQFSMAYHRISREKIDDVVSDKTNNGKLDSIRDNSVAADASDAQERRSLKSDDPADKKQNSRSYSYDSASTGYAPLHDVAYLNVSEINLQTNPFKGLPPSRPPPKISMKPEHLCADSRFDAQERRSLKSDANNQLNSTSEAFSPDAEVDPSSAAAVSIAAIKEAMEQAQVRLTRAKKLMDRRREKSHWKGSKDDGSDAYDVELECRSKVIESTEVLKESNTISESTAVEREEIRSTGKIPLSLQSNTISESTEVEEKQKSVEASVCTEKLEKDNMLKGFSMYWMDEADKNLADATMDSFLLEDHSSEIEKDFGSLQSAENLKRSEAREDNSNENDGNITGFVDDYCLHEDNVKKLVNEVNKEVKVQNENLFHDIFEKEIKEPDELFTFDETDKNKVDEEIKPWNNCEIETSMKYQLSYNAYKCDVEDGKNAAKKNEGDKFQIKEEVHILVENELEQEAIQDENRLENGLEMPEAQEKIEDEGHEQISNSNEGACCKDCNEMETREVRTVLQQDQESMGDLANQDVKNYEFLASSDDAYGKSVSENITEVPMLVENQISSNSDDQAWQLGEIEESDTRKVFLSRKEDNLLATAPDATEVSHVDKAWNHNCTEVEENNSKMNVDRERNKELETNLEEKDLDIERERERIAVERANYDARQQVLAEARVRAEKIAVERATAEARQRALAEARQKAEKTVEAEKASREARLRAERAAVERATEEARKRAIEKALAMKASADSRERTAQFSTSNKDRLSQGNRREYFKASHIKEDSDAKYRPNLDKKFQRNAQSQTAGGSSNDHIYSDSHNNGKGAESKLVSKARQERQQQTAERAANSLSERNMRDILAQREQAERDRLAESLDGEVRRWSSGKDGNLRALLSTLQYILGPDSGWQPITSTDIMNASAAKKAYRKATLCVHPDKLQQRGATIQQKYICEKVFDLLQEAWNKFNSEER